MKVKLILQNKFISRFFSFFLFFSASFSVGLSSVLVDIQSWPAFSLDRQHELLRCINISNLCHCSKSQCGGPHTDFPASFSSSLFRIGKQILRCSSSSIAKLKHKPFSFLLSSSFLGGSFLHLSRHYRTVHNGGLVLAALL